MNIKTLKTKIKRLKKLETQLNHEINNVSQVHKTNPKKFNQKIVKLLKLVVFYNKQLNELQNDYMKKSHIVSLKRNVNKFKIGKMLKLVPVNNFNHKKLRTGNKFGNKIGDTIKQYYIETEPGMSGLEIQKQNDLLQKYEEHFKNQPENTFIVHVDIASSTSKTKLLKKTFTNLQPIIQSILQTYQKPTESDKTDSKEKILDPLYVHFAGDAYGFIFFNKHQVIRWAIRTLIILYIVINIYMIEPILEQRGEVYAKEVKNRSRRSDVIVTEKFVNNKIESMIEGIHIRIGIYQCKNELNKKHALFKKCNETTSIDKPLFVPESIDEFENEKTKNNSIIRINHEYLCQAIKLEETAAEKDSADKNGIHINFEYDLKQLLSHNLAESEKIMKIINYFENKDEYTNFNKFVLKNDFYKFVNDKMIPIKNNIKDFNKLDKNKALNDMISNISLQFFQLYEDIFKNSDRTPAQMFRIPKPSMLSPTPNNDTLQYYSNNCEDFDQINEEKYKFVMYGTNYGESKLTLKLLNDIMKQIKDGFIVKVFDNQKSFYALFNEFKSVLKFSDTYLKNYSNSRLGIYELNKEDYFHPVKNNTYHKKVNDTTPENTICVLDIIGPAFNYAERVKSWGLPKDTRGIAIYSSNSSLDLNKFKRYSNDSEFKSNHESKDDEYNDLFNSKWGGSGLNSDNLYYNITDDFIKDFTVLHHEKNPPPIKTSTRSSIKSSINLNPPPV